MRLKNKIAAALLGLAALPAVAWAAVIGGTYYATQYDYREFFAATDGRNFQVILAGNAFPGVDPGLVARDLLPAMQAAKPRPALTHLRCAGELALTSPDADLRSRQRLRPNSVCAGNPAALQAGMAQNAVLPSIAETTR